MNIKQFDKTFQHPELGTLRMILINNEPWFSCRDLIRILKYQSNVTILTKNNIEPWEVMRKKIKYPGAGAQETVIISKTALLKILSNKNPKFRAFNNWVATELLPQIDGNVKREVIKPIIWTEQIDLAEEVAQLKVEMSELKKVMRSIFSDLSNRIN